MTEQKKLAVFAAALNVCRGMLYSARIGYLTKEDAEAALQAISPSHLAQVFGVPESEFQVDYTTELTSRETDRIRPVIISSLPMKSVFIVIHARETECCGVDSTKLIGAYFSKEAAKAAVARLIKQPGFRDYPDGFSIDEYPLNKDHWQDGFGGPDPD